MANEEILNEELEGEGTLITLEDEEGNEVEFEFADEVVILKVNPVDEETEEYVSIEDEELLDKLFDIFKKKYEGDIQFE